jgi:hypothetical protein
MKSFDVSRHIPSIITWITQHAVVVMGFLVVTPAIVWVLWRILGRFSLCFLEGLSFGFTEGFSLGFSEGLFKGFSPGS